MFKDQNVQLYDEAVEAREYYKKNVGSHTFKGTVRKGLDKIGISR